MFWNKHFTKTKIEDILMGFGCFKFDTMSRVSLSEDSPSVSPSVSPNVSPSVSPSVSARTYNREDKEKKRKEEEGKKASTSTSNSPVKVEDPDEESVKEAAGWKKISDMFHELEEADKHHPIWKENVCRNFGHGDMLVRYWATGIDMLKSHIICKGKWDLYTNRQKLLSMASCYFVGFEDTHNEVLAEITHLRPNSFAQSHSALPEEQKKITPMALFFKKMRIFAPK